MNKNIYSLQLLRNAKIYGSKQLAIQGLTQTATNDGVAKLARYLEPIIGGDPVVRTIVGFYADANAIEGASEAQSSYTILDVDGNAADVDQLKEAVIQINEKIGDGIPGTTLTAAINDVNDRLGSGFTAEQTVAKTIEDVKNEVIAAMTITVEASSESEEYAKVYTIKQGRNVVGEINIPKDMVVKDAKVVHGTWSGDTFTEDPEGPDVALKIEFANKEQSVVYVNLEDLIDIYTPGNGINIENNVVSIKLDAENEDAFLTVGEGGLKLYGVRAAIEQAVEDAKLIASDGISILANKKIKAVAALKSEDGVNNPITVDSDGIKFDSHLDCGYFDHSVVVAESAADIQNITDPSSTEVIADSVAAIAAMSGKTFESATVGDVELINDAKVYAVNNLAVDGVEFSGTKGASNGKFQFSAKDVVVNNITVADGSTIYNIFEGDQTNAVLESFTAKNVVVDNPSLKHNVVNIYKPVNDAVIKISDSYFNMDVNNSNALRLSNYGNASGVTVIFEDVDWTYEQSAANSDWAWAGLIIYQPAGGDAALSGNLTYMRSWNFVFKNCSYNGVKVTANNFGQHNQVFYLYNVKTLDPIADPTTNGFNVTFE